MSTARTIPQMARVMLAAEGVIRGVEEPVGYFFTDQISRAYEREIEDRLRNLDQHPASVDRVDCRSRFSYSGSGQVHIRIRLKQVTHRMHG